MFIFRLALALGKSLGEIGQLSHSELMMWRAYYDLEPWGCPVEDQRVAAQLELFFQANKAPGAKVPVFFDRLAPYREAEQPKAESLDNKVKSFFAAYQANQKRKRHSEPQPESVEPINTTNTNGD